SRVSDNDISGGAAGIVLMRESGPTVASNRLIAPRSFGIVATEIIGRTEFIANRVANAGFGLSRSIGLGALLVLGEWHVESNEVTDTGVPLGDAASISNTALGIYGDLILEARVESNLVTYANAFVRDVNREDRALLIRGLIDFRVTFGDARLTFGF